MDSWNGLRIALVIAVWVAVAGGLLLGTLWAAFGGGRAVGPEAEPLVEGGAGPSAPPDRVTSFGSGQLGAHATLGVLTAMLVTYGAARHEEQGYVALLVALAITAVPGLLMFRKWYQGWRPELGVDTAQATRPEDRLPKPLVYLHGLAAVVTVGCVIALLIAD